MTVYAYVGTYDNNTIDSIRGNGKTCSMTYSLKCDHDGGRETFTNYKTTFSHVLSFLEIVELMNDGKIKNASIGVTEIQKDLNSIGAKGDTVNFVDDAVSELRKYDNDLHWDSQRWMNVNIRLRSHVDMVMRPRKYHINGLMCPKDRCPELHRIGVYVVQPPQPFKDPVKILNAWKIGELYDSHEVIHSTMRPNTKAMAAKIRARVNA